MDLLERWEAPIGRRDATSSYSKDEREPGQQTFICESKDRFQTQLLSHLRGTQTRHESRFIQELLLVLAVVVPSGADGVEHPEQPPSGGNTQIHIHTGLFSDHLPGWIQFKAPKQGVKMTPFFD